MAADGTVVFKVEYETKDAIKQSKSLEKTMKQTDKTVKNVKKSIKDIPKDLGNKLKAATKNIGNSLKDIPKNIGKRLKDIPKDIGKKLKLVIKDIGKQIKAFPKKALKGLGKISGKIGKGFLKLSKNITIGLAGAVTAVGAFVVNSVKQFASFEKGMNEVFTLLPGISGKAMKDMESQVLDFSKEFGVLPEETIPALYSAISAGVPEDNVFDFLETSQKLAKGGVTDLETAVDGLSSVVNAYGPEVISAAEASDLMFTAVKNGKTTIDEMATSIFQVTPIASSLGIGFDEVTAAVATLTSTGTPTAVVMTQLKAAFSELGKEGSKADKAFQEITGKTFPQFVAEGGDVQQALMLMSESADANDTSIANMFGSIEAGQAALGLTAKGGESFIKNLDDMQSSAGATDKAFETMDNGISSSLDKLKAQLKVVSIMMGGGDIDPKELSSVFESIIDNILGLFNELAPSIIESLKIVLPMILKTLGDILPAVFDLFLDLIPTVLDAIISTLPLLTELISTLIPLVLDMLVESLPMLLDVGIGMIFALIDGILGALPDIIKTIVALVPTLLEKLLSKLPELITAGMQIIVQLIQGITDMLPDLIDMAITLIPEIVLALTEMLPELIEAAAEMIGTLAGALLDNIDLIIAAALEIGWAVIKAIGKSIGSGLGGLFKGLGKKNDSPASTSSFEVGGIPQFANGTDSAPGGLSIVGEDGPELIELSRGSKVIPLTSRSANNNANSSGQVVNVFFNGNKFTNRGEMNKTAQFITSQIVNTGNL